MSNKLQYSKILPIVTGIIFIAVLVKGLNLDYNQITDVAVFVTAITVSGGIFGATLKHYMNKAQAENVYKLKLGLYKEASKEHYKYNEKMYDLKWRYKDMQAFDDELDDAMLSQFEDSALSDAETTIDTQMNNASQDVEIENY